MSSFILITNSDDHSKWLGEWNLQVKNQTFQDLKFLESVLDGPSISKNELCFVVRRRHLADEVPKGPIMESALFQKATRNMSHTKYIRSVSLESISEIKSGVCFGTQEPLWCTDTTHDLQIVPERIQEAPNTIQTSTLGSTSCNEKAILDTLCKTCGLCSMPSEFPVRRYIWHC